MYVCVLNQDGEIMLHRNMKASPEPLLKAMAPYRDDLVIAVACVFPWYWLADLCAREGLPCVLGHALSMKAIHGGTAKNETVDAPKIAVLLRGGMLPQAYVYPAKRRATRDLRRRMHLGRKRAELLAHGQHTNSQYNLPTIGKNLAYTANRDGLVERFTAPAVQTNIAVDLALIGDDDPLLHDVALSIVRLAKQHDPATCSRRPSVPGIGKILRLVLLYEIHDIRRFPRVQDFLSYCRLGKGTKTSAGKQYGTSGAQIGNTSLTWAFSEAAVLVLGDHPAGQKSPTKLAHTHGQGKALTLLAQKLARSPHKCSALSFLIGHSSAVTGSLRSSLRNNRVEKNNTSRFSTAPVPGLRRAMTSSPSSSDSCSAYGGQVSMCRMSASRSYINVKCAPIPFPLARVF
jgi:transposase